MILAVGAASLPIHVQAETPAADVQTEEHDALEVVLHGGLSMPVGGLKSWNDSLGATSGLNAGFDVGYYLDQRYVLGLSFNYVQFGIDSKSELPSQHHRIYSPALTLKRYFPSGSDLVPYVLLRAGVDFPKFATLVYDNSLPKYREISYNANFAFSVGAGAYYYTSDFSGLFLEANYHMGLTKHSLAHFQGQDFTFGESVGMLDIRAGIITFFGSSN